MADPDRKSTVSVPRLKDAVREARIELAERSGVVVDLRNAEVARLELLNDALDPVFADIPEQVELFDRGIIAGDPPRLWVDMIAHVVMARDKRVYRFLQDSRYGRRVLAESSDIGEMARAVTKYVARRLVERERALEGDSLLIAQDALAVAARRRRRNWRMLGAFLLGLALGMAGLLAAAFLMGS
jgi:hypothetical protein